MGVNVKERPVGSGQWWVFVNHKGRRKAKKIGPDKRAANTVARKLREALALGEFNLGRADMPYFKPYAKKWLKLPHEQKSQTIEEYERKLRLHAYPSIGRMRLDEIERKHLHALCDDLLIKGLKPTTINIVKAVISEVLEHAISRDLISSNPARKLRWKHKKRRLQIDPLTEEEAELLLEKSRQYLNGKYYPMLLTLLRTGIRIGEMIALKWDDIDFDNRKIEISRTYVKGRFSTPKSGKTGYVSMSNQLGEVLKNLRTEHKKWALKSGMPVSEFVFVKGKWKAELAASVRYALEKCLEIAGLRRIRLHDLRHSYATIRLSKGHSIYSVSKEMRHGSVAFTLDCYGHYQPSKFRHEIDELDAQPMSN